MKIDILTLFPNYFAGPVRESIMKRAQEAGLVEVKIHDLRDFTRDKHKTADDKPFGGGAGMVMKPEPIFECVDSLKSGGWKVLLTPQGRPFDQKVAKEYSQKEHLILIAGHYEGIDYRVHEQLADDEVSVGDFVTMGGEAPALCIIEAVVRLIPGVLGNAESLDHESFNSGHLEYPQYTRPREYRGLTVPEVLVSGNHEQVDRWRRQKATELTQKRRPDLL